LLLVEEVIFSASRLLGRDGDGRRDVVGILILGGIHLGTLILLEVVSVGGCRVVVNMLDVEG